MSYYADPTFEQAHRNLEAEKRRKEIPAPQKIIKKRRKVRAACKKAMGR